MQIRDADGIVFDLPQHVATGLVRSRSNTFELVTDETEAQTDTGTPAPPVDEKPTRTWTNPQIAKWAKDHDVDLAGATKKDDMLRAITAADIAQTAVRLDEVLTPPGQDRVIVDDTGDEPDEISSGDGDDIPAEDEDDNLEPDDPEPEDDESDGKD